MQCYAEMISSQEAAGKTPEEVKTERKKLFELAGSWRRPGPRSTPGDMARNQLALLYINEKDPEAKRDENVQQAILALSRITPGYSNYTVTQYQLAQFAFGAEKEKIMPMPGDGRGRLPQAGNGGAGEHAAADGRRRSDDEQGLFPRQSPSWPRVFTLKKYDEMEKLSERRCRR